MKKYAPFSFSHNIPFLVLVSDKKINHFHSLSLSKMFKYESKYANHVNKFVKVFQGDDIFIFERVNAAGFQHKLILINN